MVIVKKGGRPSKKKRGPKKRCLEVEQVEEGENVEAEENLQSESDLSNFSIGPPDLASTRNGKLILYNFASITSFQLFF